MMSCESAAVSAPRRRARRPHARRARTTSGSAAVRSRQMKCVRPSSACWSARRASGGRGARASARDATARTRSMRTRPFRRSGLRRSPRSQRRRKPHFGRTGQALRAGACLCAPHRGALALQLARAKRGQRCGAASGRGASARRAVCRATQLFELSAVVAASALRQRTVVSRLSHAGAADRRHASAPLLPVVQAHTSARGRRRAWTAAPPAYCRASCGKRFICGERPCALHHATHGERGATQDGKKRCPRRRASCLSPNSGLS